MLLVDRDQRPAGRDLARNRLVQNVGRADDNHPQCLLLSLDLDAGSLIPAEPCGTDVVQSSEQVFSFECDVDAEPPLFRGLLSPDCWLVCISYGYMKCS